MKKLLLITLILHLQHSPLFCQYSPYKWGTIVLSGGYGFPSFIQLNQRSHTDYLDYSDQNIGPIHGKLGLTFGRRVELLLSVNSNNYEGNWYQENNGNRFRYHYLKNGTSLNGRVNIHLADLLYSDQIDLYWGLGFGKDFYTKKKTTDNPNDPSFNQSISSEFWSMEATLGFRWFFIRNVGLFAEVGYAKSLIQAGIVLKTN